MEKEFEPPWQEVCLDSEVTGFRGRGLLLAQGDMDGDPEPVFAVQVLSGEPLGALELHREPDGRHWFLHSEIVWRH